MFTLAISFDYFQFALNHGPNIQDSYAILLFTFSLFNCKLWDQESELSSYQLIYTKWYARMLSHFSCIQLFAIPWTIAHQASLSVGILQARILEWVALPSSRGSSWPSNWTCVSYVCCIGRRVLYHWHHLGGPLNDTHTHTHTHTHIYREREVLFLIQKTF